MKLIECYIENFGKLSSYSHTFSDGLNVIIGKNGCGKTTLSVFIKAMLYGIDFKKIKGEETDRKRYLPWQGGRYGGSLTFENAEKRYRIERTFGEKSSQDSFAIYDLATGAISSDFSENVGEELFDIDADGFERTVFLSEKKFSVSTNNQTVSAKLSNLVGVDGDMGNYDSAIDQLEKREKFYQHRRGKGGLVGDIKTDISGLDAEILEISRKKDICKEAEKELSFIAEKAEKAQKQKEAIEAQKISDAYKKEYLAKQKSLKEYEERLEREKLFFKGNIPTQREISINEEKRSQALLLMKSAEANAKLLEKNFSDNSAEIENHLNVLNSQKTTTNANNSWHISLTIAFLALISAIILGAAFNPVFYLISILFIPFMYLSARQLKCISKQKNAKEKAEEIKAFVLQKTGNSVSDDELHSSLTHLKAEAIAEKKERARLESEIKGNNEAIKSLTNDYEAFLSNFEVLSDEPFSEIREHLSSYETLLEEISRRSREAEAYALEHGMKDFLSASESDFPIFSEELLASAETELRALKSEKYSLEARLSSLYDDVSREDELKERRLELCDALADAQFNHKITLKATEHLKLAKERLTAKYLGKMRSAFDGYITEIASEKKESFALDTDFSLTKTENGLTNPIGSYSLGTKELYSLATRLALIDALYENNSPFIILDDPFCHFDDKKCEAALNAIKKIAADKQIIYLTCSDSRTPK